MLLAQATAAAPTEQALKGILKAGMESEGNEMNDEQIQEFVKALLADPRRMKFFGKVTRSVEMLPSRDHHFETMHSEMHQYKEDFELD